MCISKEVTTLLKTLDLGMELAIDNEARSGRESAEAGIVITDFGKDQMLQFHRL